VYIHSIGNVGCALNGDGTIVDVCLDYLKRADKASVKFVCGLVIILEECISCIKVEFVCCFLKFSNAI
jgi:hypothetical protein